MNEEKAIKLLRKYAPDKRTYDIVLNHGKAVQTVAERLSREKEVTKAVDIEFLRTAALLHDIGRFRTGKTGTKTIRHGLIGANILRKEGYPRHARVAERHIGAGLTKQEIVRCKLPLPKRDYIPKTLEEKIIAQADNLVAGTKEVSLGEAVRRLRKRVGKEASQRIIELQKDIENDAKNKVKNRGQSKERHDK